MAALISLAISVADPDPLQALGDIEIGLVEGQRLDEWRVAGEDRPDLLRDLLIDLKARLHKNEAGTPALGRDRRHRRVDAERSRLVAGRSHHSSGVWAAHSHRLAAKLRIVALLDRRVERIHIDVNDFARQRNRRPRRAHRGGRPGWIAMLLAFMSHAMPKAFFGANARCCTGSA